MRRGLPLILCSLGVHPRESGEGAAPGHLQSPSWMEVVFPPDTCPALGPLCCKHLGSRETLLREHLLAPCPKGQSSFCWTFYLGSTRQFSWHCQSKERVTGRPKVEAPRADGPAVPRVDSGMQAGRSSLLPSTTSHGSFLSVALFAQYPERINNVSNLQLHLETDICPPYTVFL